MESVPWIVESGVCAVDSGFGAVDSIVSIWRWLMSFSKHEVDTGCVFR